MIEQKKFSGVMNLDDDNSMLLPAQHKSALNGRFYGTQSGLIFEGIKGNTLIINPYLPASGTNESIGAYFDQLKQRVFSFNWNSNGSHGIYMYNINTGLFTRLIENFINTQAAIDILFFDLDFPIASVNILYTTEADGDILTWVQRNRRPAELNILSATNNIYGSNWLASYLDVAKEPPSIPIKCAYEDDATVTVNNLNPAKQIYKFKYRFIYDNFQKSVTSAQSDVPIPFEYSLPENNTDPTKNARIAIVYQTGAANVVKIEILAAQGLGDLFSDFFSIAIINKADLSISDNDTSTFLFYNNEAYNYIDKAESVQLFDYVPYRANTQELLNGNVLDYSGIIEGLDPIVPNITISQSTINPTAVVDTAVMSVTQEGKSGFGTGNIHFVIAGNPQEGQSYQAEVFYSPSSSAIITYVAVIGDTVADVLTGLAASATGFGFTVVTINARNLVISRATQVLLRSLIQGAPLAFTASGSYTATLVTILNSAQYIDLFKVGRRFFISIGNPVFTVITTPTVAATSLLIPISLPGLGPGSFSGEDIILIPYTNESIPAYDWSSKENIAIEYLNDKGVTCGALTKKDFNIISAPINSDTINGGINFINTFLINIFNRPPLEAAYFHLLRTKNTTASNYLYWVTGGSYKDDKFAYVSIGSIATYNIIYPTSTNVIGYEFAAGDRIKFCVRYHTDRTVDNNYGEEHDYEIIESKIAIENGLIPLTGQYVKIPLPEVSTNFNFGIPGVTDNDNYNYYLVKLYTPAKAVANGLDVYYESVFRGEIGDAGLPTRFHQGVTQNQSPDLMSPAIIYTRYNGDVYYRQRGINLGFYLQYAILAHPSTDGGLSFGSTRLKNTIPEQKLIVQSEKNDSFYANPIIIQQYFDNSGNAPGFTIKQIARKNVRVHITGTINVVADSNAISGQSYIFQIFYLTNSLANAGVTAATIPDTAKVGNSFSLPVDVYFDLPAGTLNEEVPLILRGESTDETFNITIQDGNLNIVEVDKTFNIGIIDQNYSDFFESKGNSNGRPLVVDPEAGQRFYATLNRNSLAYIQNTSINKTNRFFAENFVEWDRSKGQVQRLKLRGTALRVFFERGVGVVPINQNVLQTADNTNQVTQSSRLLNDIQYYQGEFGMGSQYCGLASSAGADYVIDPVRGYHIRVSGDGMTPISELYKGQYWFRNLVTPYNKEYKRSNGSLAKILQYFDFFEEQAVPVLQAGTLTPTANTLNVVGVITDIISYVITITGMPTTGYAIVINIANENGDSDTFTYIVKSSDTIITIYTGIIAVVNQSVHYEAGFVFGGAIQILNKDEEIAISSASISTPYPNAPTISNYAFSFNEKRNGYASFYSFAPEWIICAEDVTYSWKNGNMYVHNNTANYCNFYGVQYDCYVVVVFNANLLEKKSWESVAQLASDIWACPEISTNLKSYGSTFQQSNLIPTDFDVLEQMPSASFYRDSNSQGGLINGDQLKGNWIMVKFQKTAASDLITLSETAIRVVDSPLTAK